MFFALTKNQRDPVAVVLPYSASFKSIAQLARESRDALSVREMDPYVLRGIYLELHARIFGAAPFRVDEAKLDIALGRVLSWCVKNDIDAPAFIAAQMHSMVDWFKNPACKFRTFQPTMLTSANAIKRFNSFQARGNKNKRDALDGLEYYRDIGVMRSDLVSTEFEIGKVYTHALGDLSYSASVEEVRNRGLLHNVWCAAHFQKLTTKEDREVSNRLHRMFNKDRLEAEKKSAFLVAVDAVLTTHAYRIPHIVGSVGDFEWSDVLRLVQKVSMKQVPSNPPEIRGIAGRFLWKAAL